MRRRPEDQHGGIELLDVVAEPTGAVDEAVSSSGSSRWLPLALVGVVGLALAGVATSGGDPAAAPTSEPTPSVTVSVPQPDTTASTSTGQPLVRLGDGPDLDWMPVPVDVGTAAFTWSDGEFVANDGDTEWRLTVGDEGPVVGRADSVLAANPGYRTQRTDGGWVLAPVDSLATHVLVAMDTSGGEVDRIDLPPPVDPVDNELIEVERWVDADVIGKRVVIAISDGTRIDVAELAERATTGDLDGIEYAWVEGNRLYVDVPFERATGPTSVLLSDLGLEEADIEVLQSVPETYVSRLLVIDLEDGSIDEPLADDVDWIGDIAASNGELAVTWGGLGAPQRSVTIDGVEWTQEILPTSFPFVIDAGLVSYRPDFEGRGTFGRSLDDGQTWQEARLPLRDRFAAFTEAAISLGSPWFTGSVEAVAVPSDDPSVVVTVMTGSDHIVVSSADDPDAVLAETRLWDERRSTWRPESEAWSISNDSGAEVARVRQEDLDVALNQGRADHDIAFGSWPLEAEEAEWRVVSLRETFGVDARRVAFVAGSDAILAVVTTTSGYELYISPLTAS